jgi:hypothetical protein
MTRLNRSLEDLASRGRPRGASDVFAGATSGADATAGPIDPVVRPWMAFAAAFGGVLMVGLVMAVVMSGGERAGQVGSPSATTPTGAPCLAPPVEATGTEGASFFVDVKPAEVTAGSLANLTLAVFEGDPAGFVTGLDTAWQCWDGSEWVDIFQLLKGTAGYAPGVAEPGSGIDAIGLILPLEASILIPDVGPGIYRVFESAAGDDGMRASWTFVEVFDPASSPTTTIEPTTTTTGQLPTDSSCPAETHGNEPEIKESLFPMTPNPISAAPGSQVDLHIGLPDHLDHGGIGLDAYWQCWNGAKWVDTHLLRLGMSDSPGFNHASAVPWGESWAVLLPSFQVPRTVRVMIPDVDPGSYRIREVLSYFPTPEGPAEGIHGFVMVEVIGDAP